MGSHGKGGQGHRPLDGTNCLGIHKLSLQRLMSVYNDFHNSIYYLGKLLTDC